MMPISTQPLVSVVIPTYNRADLIYRAVDSVRLQTYQNWEIIVVDDCSQEDIAGAVQKINDDRITFIRHNTNKGGSEARNTGIKQAKGEYVAFLDSDDIWLPQKLELQLKAIVEADVNKESVVSYTKFQKSDRVFYQPSVLPRRGKKPNETIADYLWLGGGETLTSTLLLSRTLATEHLFQNKLGKHEDLDFVLSLGYSQASFIFVPQVLTIWHNEARSDRVSRRRNYQLSLNWIALHRDKISSKAYQGFILKEVVPKMLLDPESKSTAIELLVAGLKANIIPIHYFLFLIVKQAMSQEFQQSIKAGLQKIKVLRP